MSDFEIRLRERAYAREPSMQNAQLLISAYQRSQSQPTDWRSLQPLIDQDLQSTSDFYNLGVLSYDLSGMPERRQNEIAVWVDAVASFTSTSDVHWENIVYIATLDSEDEDVNSFRRIRSFDAFDALPDGHPWRHHPGEEPLPTPLELVPIIQSAYEHGAAYISFHFG